MIFALLSQEPVLALLWVVAVVSAFTVHEYAHALVAHLRGDATAAWEGRLSLNPLVHIDWLGFFMLIFLGFGWAKPVPFDPRRLRKPVTDGALIGLAGPAANGLFILAAALVIRLVPLSADNLLPVFLFLVVYTNAGLLAFNLLPIHPLDGAKLLDAILIKLGLATLGARLEHYGPQILLGAVLLSLLTPLQPFFMVSWAAGKLADLALGSQFSLF